MIVAGVMSGTSADGIDVALVRVLGRGLRTRLELLAHHHAPYPAAVRRAVLEAMNAPAASVAELARLNFLLGELYADAVLTAQRRFRVKVRLVGCHGQTLYHQATAARFLGREVTCTWQTGEGAVVAARVGGPVVSDFRPADMAAGGKGAPLVPYLDYLLYRGKTGRVVQNLGGIANLTAIPPNAAADEVIAFDTGPGNMVIDAVVERLFDRSYDRNGAIAARGKMQDGTIETLLDSGYFRQPPPKAAGREQFGREFAAGFVKACGRARKEDIVATATALTARSIGEALRRFVFGRPRAAGPHGWEYIVSGGGANNRTLLQMIAREVLPMGMRMRRSEEFGLPAEAKEATAFAVLAYETWQKRPSNLPAATGARRAAVLGKVSLP